MSFPRHKRLTLAGIKRCSAEACAKLAQFRGRKVWIRSGEHGAWWRPEAAGYTDIRDEAGVYDFDDA